MLRIDIKIKLILNKLNLMKNIKINHFNSKKIKYHHIIRTII